MREGGDRSVTNSISWVLPETGLMEISRNFGHMCFLEK